MTPSINTSDVLQQATEWLQQFIPAITPENLRQAGAILLGLLAALFLLAAVRLLRKPRSRNTSSTRTDIPRILQRRGAVIDILAGATNNTISVRCVITSAKPGKITCEIIERLDTIKTPVGKDVVCIFAPMKTRSGKINTFTATLVESDRSGRPDRIKLSTPVDYTLLPRRQHARKRVADQQFIRVKLWLADPKQSDTAFEDAAPQIGVNAFAADDPEQTANGVINISNGGLGLSILNHLLPETCAPDTPAVINLFMFNFRKKTFEPYWYTGTIRSLEEGRPGFTRMGLEFTGTGHPDRTSGRINWTLFQD